MKIRKRADSKKNSFLYNITAEICMSPLANFSSSISGQTQELIIYVMRKQTRADNLLLYTIIIVEVVCRSTWLLPRGSTATLACVAWWFKQLSVSIHSCLSTKLLTAHGLFSQLCRFASALKPPSYAGYSYFDNVMTKYMINIQTDA